MSKKIIIPKENLPDINVFTKKYGVRFRITTEDRNRFSYWSPIFSIDPGLTYIPSGDLIIEKHTGYSIAVWNPVGIEKDSTSIGELSEYDLWVRWGTDPTNGTWQYKERISATSISLIKPTSPAGLDHLSIEVYRPGTPIYRRAMYDIDQSNSAALINLSTDVITLPENVFKTGYRIHYESTTPVGGLSDDSYYYARMLTDTTMTLHPTYNDSINDTNKIDITSNTNDVGFFTWADCTVCDFLLYSNYNFNPV
jgi:hypothetical protein